MLAIEDKKELKKTFLDVWPAERVAKMSLEEYTNLNREDSFCYWLESRTQYIGSIWGGTSYKFGIYERKDTKGEDNRNGYSTNGKYGWYSKYGQTPQEAFETVRSHILKVIEAAKQNELTAIDAVDLGDAVKWKIAFLYSDYNVINIFKREAIYEVARKKGLPNADDKEISELHSYLVSQKTDGMSFYVYTSDLWEMYDNNENGSPNEDIEVNSSDLTYWLYAPGPGAEYWDRFYDNGIMAIGWDYLGDLKKFTSREEVAERIRELEGTDSSKKNDAKTNYQFAHEMQVGDIIIVKRGVSELLGYGVVASDYSFDDTRDHYKNIRKVDWKLKGSWTVPFNLVQKTLTDVTDYASDHPEYGRYHERLFGIMGVDRPEVKVRSLEQAQRLDLTGSLNRILYGPPGTGKTYSLYSKYAPLFIQKHKEKTPREFETEKVGALSWWEVVALVLLMEGELTVPEIKKHRFIHIKENASDNNNVNAVIWAMLQTHTSPEQENVRYASRQEPFLFEKSTGSVWSINRKDCEQKAPHLLEILKSIERYDSQVSTRQNFRFTTFHQSFTYEDFVEGIKPKLNTDSAEPNGQEIQYVIEKGIFYQAADEACRLAGFLGLQDCLNSDSEERSERFTGSAPYALFIDEINRGNISAIFGELITLIEDDKRLTKKHELIVQLPYSKKPFAVPPNLYIFGTMNTADRSVEALDTALRRRFQFEEMAPKPEIITTKGKAENGSVTVAGEEVRLEELLEIINQRIEKILDRDHLIGHSYFMKVKNWRNLQTVFQQNIIPLLEEYFYGDKGKIQLVLGKGFIERVNGQFNKKLFPETEYPDQGLFEDREVWKVQNAWTKDEQAFAEALKVLASQN